MPRSRTRSKKSRRKKVLVKRALRRSSRSPVTRSYTQPYRRYKGTESVNQLDELREFSIHLREASDKLQAFKDKLQASDPVKQQQTNQLLELVSQQLEETHKKIVEYLMTDERLFEQVFE